MRLGVLDVGSNTVHLLVVDAHRGAAPIAAHSLKNELRLAEHTLPDGSLDDAVIDALIGFVRHAISVAEDLGCEQVITTATSALREATNGPAALARVRELTGVELTVLSGEQEADLTFHAVRRWFGWSSGRLLVLDIGGGSLEMAVGIEESPDAAVSLPLGAGRMFRQFLQTDPPSEEEVAALRRHARQQIAAVASKIARQGTPEHVVATSKTFKQLARIAGAAPTSAGEYVRRSLTLADLRLWTSKLVTMTADERRLLPGTSAHRAPQLVAGALVAEAAMEVLGIPQVEICPWALREGVILRFLDALEV